MVECPSGLRSTPRKRVRFSASESSNLSSTAPRDSKRFLESLFSYSSPPFFRAVAIVQRHSSVLQSIAKGYKRRHWESRLSPPRRRSETVIVRRQEKGDEKHEDRGCGKLEKTERPDSPPTPLQQKRRLDTTRPGRPAKTGQRACMFAALRGNQRHKISGSRCSVDVPAYIARASCGCICMITSRKAETRSSSSASRASRSSPVVEECARQRKVCRAWGDAAGEQREGSRLCMLQPSVCSRRWAYAPDMPTNVEQRRICEDTEAKHSQSADGQASRRPSLR